MQLLNYCTVTISSDMLEEMNVHYPYHTKVIYLNSFFCMCLVSDDIICIMNHFKVLYNCHHFLKLHIECQTFAL